MGFSERLSKIRAGKNLSIPDLSKLSSIHVVQLRRYEKGESEPTLDALRKLTVALNVAGDELLFDKEERRAPESFTLQLETLAKLNDEDQKSIKAIIDGLLIRQQTKNLAQKG